MKENANILLLDDEPLARMMAAMVLRRAGAVVSEAGTCEEALRLARDTAFDAAVLDHRLPDGYGVELVQTLRREGAAFPVVMLSGEAADIGCSPEAGIGAVLEKPVDPEQLLAALAEAVRLGGPPATEKVGNYLVWHPGAEPPEGPVDHLAVDMLEWGDDPVPEPLMKLLRQPRRATAVVGATEAVRAQVKALEPAIDWVDDMEELAALSRRPTSPAERGALLGG